MTPTIMKRERFDLRPSLLSWLVLVLLCAAGSGCSSFAPEPDPDWQEVEVPISSDRVLWKLMLLAAETKGFPITGSMDPSTREMLTGWKVNLQPFSGRGTRMRAELKMEPKEEGVWLVSAHVQKQINKAMVAPLDPTRAEWEWTADDALETQLLLRHVHSALPAELDLRNEPKESFEQKVGRRPGSPTS